jgi:hypothetical protein
MLCTEFKGDGARILGIFPSASPSHHIVFQAIMKTLAARGHHVTVISTDPLKVRITCKVALSSQLYRLKEKCTAKPTEGESTPQYKTKVLYEHRPSEA